MKFRTMIISFCLHLIAPFLFTLEKTPLFPTYRIRVRRLYAEFYGTFNSTTLNQIEAGSRLMQQLDSVLQYRRQAGRDQMAKRFKRCYLLKL